MGPTQPPPTTQPPNPKAILHPQRAGRTDACDLGGRPGWSPNGSGISVEPMFPETSESNITPLKNG